MHRSGVRPSSRSVCLSHRSTPATADGVKTDFDFRLSLRDADNTIARLQPRVGIKYQNNGRRMLTASNAVCN